jgi:small nuclear ribonucleoprotein (snRNP)-like protein
MKEKERVLVKMTDGSQFEGDLASATKALSLVETLNDPSPFVLLEDISIGGIRSEHYVILNKAQIVSISPVAKGQG